MAASRLTDLPALRAACWQQLQQAAHDRGHDWRVMTLATAAAGVADARSVVIRDVLPGEQQLVFYTDSRAPKVQQALAQPRAVLLAWSRTLSWQLRLQVLLQVQTEGLEVSSRWAQLKLRPGAQDYLSPLPPGAVLSGGAPPPPERASRAHFAVVTAQVLALDWLELHADGHRRAMFDDTGARWLQP